MAKNSAAASRRAWPIYRIESDDRLEISEYRERTEMVQDPHTDEWWYRHSYTIHVVIKNLPRAVLKMTPWTKPAHPVAVGHTPGPRARRVARACAQLPALPEGAVAAHTAALKARGRALKQARRKAARAEARKEVGLTVALGYIDDKGQYVPFDQGQS